MGETPHTDEIIELLIKQMLKPHPDCSCSGDMFHACPHCIKKTAKWNAHALYQNEVVNSLGDIKKGLARIARYYLDKFKGE